MNFLKFFLFRFFSVFSRFLFQRRTKRNNVKTCLRIKKSRIFEKNRKWRKKSMIHLQIFCLVGKLFLFIFVFCWKLIEKSSCNSFLDGKGEGEGERTHPDIKIEFFIKLLTDFVIIDVFCYKLNGILFFFINLRRWFIDFRQNW